MSDIEVDENGIRTVRFGLHWTPDGPFAAFNVEDMAEIPGKVQRKAHSAALNRHAEGRLTVDGMIEDAGKVVFYGEGRNMVASAMIDEEHLDPRPE